MKKEIMKERVQRIKNQNALNRILSESKNKNCLINLLRRNKNFYQNELNRMKKKIIIMMSEMNKMSKVNHAKHCKLEKLREEFKDESIQNT